MEKTDLVIVVPAFVVCELTEAFQIGFVLFLPFLVIDLIVSNILQALRMAMLALLQVALPFKLFYIVRFHQWLDTFGAWAGDDVYSLISCRVKKWNPMSFVKPRKLYG